MPMVVMVRENFSYSPFRDALIDLMNAPGDNLILAYGYITSCLSDTHNSNSIACDFITALSSSNMRNCTIWLIAGNFKSIGGTSKEQKHANRVQNAYNNLVTFLKGNPYGINFKIVYADQKVSSSLWHGKIALKVQINDINNPQVSTDKVSAVLIGSSNLSAHTTAEFSHTPTNPIQSNCDVYFWDRRVHTKSAFRGITVHKKQKKEVSSPTPLWKAGGATVIAARPYAPLNEIFEHIYLKLIPYLK